jgi:hypothetical protein
MLIKTMLVTIQVHTAISFHLPPCFIKAMEKIFKAFLWTSTEVVHDGKCLVAWTRVQRSLHLAQARSHGLQPPSHALCLRWLRLSRTDDMRSWMMHPVKEDAIS